MTNPGTKRPWWARLLGRSSYETVVRQERAAGKFWLDRAIETPTREKWNEYIARAAGHGRVVDLFTDLNLVEGARSADAAAERYLADRIHPNDDDPQCPYTSKQAANVTAAAAASMGMTVPQYELHRATEASRQVVDQLAAETTNLANEGRYVEFHDHETRDDITEAHRLGLTFQQLIDRRADGM